MSNKIRAISEGLAVPATIHTANLAKGTYVKITGDAKVDAVDTENDFPIGFIRKSTRDVDGSGTVETRFDLLVDAKCSGAIAAGDRVKIGANVGGVQTFKKFTPSGGGADVAEAAIGICWIGAADTATGTFLLF